MTAEDNQYFRPVREFCQRAVVTCTADAPLLEVVRTMRENGISCVIVVADGMPQAIFTDRDLRNKVVAEDRSPADLKVADVMNAPLAVIGEDDVLYEALYRLSCHRIHRLVVVDGAGRLAGVVTDTDILRLQANSPHQLALDIGRAGSIDELRQLHGRIQQLVLQLSAIGIAVREMVRLIARLNDQLLIRLIGLLRADKHCDLPERFAFVVMGSEGRGEQTLSTDQDNAIIWDDALDAAAVARVEAFSHDLIDALIAVGVPPCPGGIMAKNPAWRRSLDGWKGELGTWLARPTPDNVMSGSMFMDLRTLYGDPSLEQALKARIYAHTRDNPVFLMRMAQNMTHFLPPLGWFGRIRVEKEGEHRGQLDLKKAGIFAITDGVRALALEAGRLDGSTHDRIEALTAAGVLKAREAADLAASFDFLVLLRLRGQIDALRQGRAPDNFIALDRLNALEQGELKLALDGVTRFQDFIKQHFRLQLLGN